MFRKFAWRNIAKASTASFLITLLMLSAIATPSALAIGPRNPFTKASEPAKSDSKVSPVAGKLTEVAPPAVLRELGQTYAANKPQVKILSPRPGETLSDDRVSVQFQVKDLTTFKDKTFGLGPHLHVFLDNQPYQAVYDLSKPLILDKLTPGTHTIRAFASRPWHESFKNEGAYAQVTFHVYAKTQDNNPDPALPLLTYSRPQASYGAEPIMLDFYLTNAPLHLVAREDKQDDIPDWRIRCTVNGNSFVLDQWQPIYLKGFKPGKNWVQLEFLDENGNPVKNVFNNTVRVINYEPGGKDPLSKLVRGELTALEARSIVDPTYKPPTPVPTPSPSPTPDSKVSPAKPERPTVPAVKGTPTPVPSISPTPLLQPSPSVVVPKASPSSQPTTSPVPSPLASPSPTPKVSQTPALKPEPSLPQTTASPTPTVTPVPTAKAEAESAQAQDKPAQSLFQDFRKRLRSPSTPEQTSPTPTVSPTPGKPPVPLATPSPLPSPTVESSPAPLASPKAIAPSASPQSSDRPNSVEILQPQKAPQPTLVKPEAAVTTKPAPAAAPGALVPSIPQSSPSVEAEQPSEHGSSTEAEPAPASIPPTQPERVPGKSSAELDRSQAMKDIKDNMAAKATELKSTFASKFSQLREQFRQSRPTAPKPTPSTSSSPAVTPSADTPSAQPSSKPESAPAVTPASDFYKGLRSPDNNPEPVPSTLESDTPATSVEVK